MGILSIFLVKINYVIAVQITQTFDRETNEDSKFTFKVLKVESFALFTKKCNRRANSYIAHVSEIKITEIHIFDVDIWIMGNR